MLGMTRISTSILAAIVACAPAAHAAKWKYETKLSLNPRYYPEDIGEGTTQTETPIIFEPTVSAKVSSALRFRFTPYLYSDPASPSRGEKFFADATEANMEVRFGDSSVSLGLNQIAWGATDIYNPLDVVSPRRYFDPLNSDKRSVPSVLFTHESGDWRWEALYIPVQLPSILPGENSRWLPRDVSLTRSETPMRIVLPTDLRYHYDEPREIDGALHHNFGGRVEIRKSGVDLSAIFFQGAPTTPSIMPIVTGLVDWPDDDAADTFTVDPDVRLRPDYYLRRTAGASAVFTIDTAIVRFAAAASDKVTNDPNVPGWSQSAVLGFEHNMSVGSATLTALLQGTYARHEQNADNSVTSVDRIFDRSFLLGFRLATSTEWVVTLAGLHESVSKGNLLQFKAEKKIADGLTGSIIGEAIEAPSNTTMGSFERNDRVGLGLSFFF